MPELPEVEGIRRQLLPRVTDRTLAELAVCDTTRWHPAEGLDASAATNRRFRDITRHAKLLRVALDGDLTVLIHLKLAGQVVYQASDGARIIGGHPYPLPGASLPDTSTRFVLSLDDGATIFLNDQRRFCWLRLLPDAEAQKFIAKQQYGPDPLAPGFTVELLASRLAARRGRPIKVALLDQTCIVGLGNIYVDESLHLSHLHPMTKAGDVTPAQVAALHEAILGILKIAVPVGGAIVKNGKAVDDPGSGRDFLHAHGRAGLPCPDCDPQHGPPETITRAFLAGRGTYFCLRCQPAPPGFVMPEAATKTSKRKSDEYEETE